MAPIQHTKQLKDGSCRTHYAAYLHNQGTLLCYVKSACCIVEPQDYLYCLF